MRFTPNPTDEVALISYVSVRQPDRANVTIKREEHHNFVFGSIYMNYRVVPDGRRRKKCRKDCANGP
jgi:hypothetical protein